MSSVQPSYYNSNGADVIEMLSKTLEPAEFRGFMKGNIIKYATRYDKKNGVEDLDKCAEYKLRLAIWEINDHQTTVPPETHVYTNGGILSGLEKEQPRNGGADNA